MKKFLQKSSKFIILILLIGFVSFLTLNDETKWNRKFFLPKIGKVFDLKIKYFQDFIDEKKSINLLLGSSHMMKALIPDSLGTKWFSFANDSQSFYDHYNFIKYYRNSVQIDTIIVSIAPFDFAPKDRPLDIDLILFRKDSLSVGLYRELQLLKYEEIKSKLFHKLLDYYSLLIPETQYTTKVDEQGFVYNVPYSINEDSLYNNNPYFFTYDFTNYFKNVTKKPNFTDLNIFNSYCQQNDIHIIYLLPPMSKYYSLRVEKEKKDEWDAIINGLNEYGVELWDYERINNSLSNESFFSNATHLSYNGAKVFTKIIKNRLLK